MNKMSLISESLSQADSARTNSTQVVGMMKMRSALDTIKDASERPNPRPLWLSLWYEGEACCLFADTNLGKSILAVQVAEHIARDMGMRVLYFDFELSDKQFQLRYTDEMGNLYPFSPNLTRVEIDPTQMGQGNFESLLMDNIEECANATDARVLIIDNLTWMCNASEKGDAAGDFMLRLMQMKKEHGLSILVIAHTPKRNLTSPITQNDLAGSKKLINFFDSSFAIGQSAKDANLRYIKQIKCRNGSFEYNAENVIVCQVIKEQSFAQFETLGYTTEAEHLKQYTEAEASARDAKIIEMLSQGKSQRAIAREMRLSPGTINRIAKEQKGGAHDE